MSKKVTTAPVKESLDCDEMDEENPEQDDSLKFRS